MKERLQRYVLLSESLTRICFLPIPVYCLVGFRFNFAETFD